MRLLFIWQIAACLVRGRITFSSRSGFGTPMACQCNYRPLCEQPVGSEQVSGIPCRVIRLIHNHRHFQSPSPARLRHYGAWLQSNLVLSHRMSIRSCLCWRRAPLILWAVQGARATSCWVVNMISEALCLSLNMICAQVGSEHVTQHTHTHVSIKRHQLIYNEFRFTELCVYKSQCSTFILHWSASGYLVIHPTPLVQPG